MRNMKIPVILLVEDNPADIKLTKLVFEKSKVVNELIVSRDGQEALDYLFGECANAVRDLRHMPALVLLDLKLPKVDGMEVLQRIRADERTRCLPVIVLTSSREEQDVIRSYHLGANSYICKPVDFDQFVDAAQQLSCYWLVLNEPPPRVWGSGVSSDNRI